jgi:hypothetical protein
LLSDLDRSVEQTSTTIFASLQRPQTCPKDRRSAHRNTGLLVDLDKHSRGRAKGWRSEESQGSVFCVRCEVVRRSVAATKHAAPLANTAKVAIMQ